MEAKDTTQSKKLEATVPKVTHKNTENKLAKLESMTSF